MDSLPPERLWRPTLRRQPIFFRDVTSDIFTETYFDVHGFRSAN